MVVRVGRHFPTPQDSDDSTLICINTEQGFPTSGACGVIYYRALQSKLYLLSAEKKLFGKQGRAGFAQRAIFQLFGDATEFLIRNSGETEYRIISIKNGRVRSVPVSRLKDAVNSGLLDSCYADPAWRDRITWTKVR